MRKDKVFGGLTTILTSLILLSGCGQSEDTTAKSTGNESESYKS